MTSATKINDIVKCIKSNNIKNVIILTGAGISCITGIPDFRSPGGMYNTLKPELITATAQERNLLKSDPTYVVHINMFKKNPFPYLEVRRPFILGSAENKWKPSLSHFFFKVLQDKGILQRLYTQNIDGLDFKVGLDENKIVNIHGTLSKIRCEFCSTSYPEKKFIDQIKSNIKNIYDQNDKNAPQESSKIFCPNCNEAGIKPTTVLYGTKIPDAVWEHIDEDFIEKADLLIIAGTSLTVSPACDFVRKVKPTVHRLVINNEVVGKDVGLRLLDKKSLDSILLGGCDEGFLYLATQLEWIDDLYIYKDLMCEASASLIEDTYNTFHKKINKN